MPERKLGFFVQALGNKQMRLLLCLLGLVLIVEGLPYFAFPGKMKQWLTHIQELPDRHLRIMGFFAMAVGLMIAYFFRE